MKKEFLVCYDYDTGGIWMIFRARSAQEIEKKYPYLTVFTDRPDWMNERPERENELIYSSARKFGHYDIDEPPSGWLLDYVTLHPEELGKS